MHTKRRRTVCRQHGRQHQGAQADVISEQVKAWGYALTRLREGMQARLIDANDAVAGVAAGVDLQVVVAPPVTSGQGDQQEAYQEASQVFAQLGASVHDLADVSQVGQRAAEILSDSYRVAPDLDNLRWIYQAPPPPIPAEAQPAFVANTVRAAAVRLARDYDPDLPAQVEAVLAARGTSEPVDRYLDPVSLGGLIVAIASLGWTVYADRRERTGRRSRPDTIAREVRAALREQEGLLPQGTDRIIDVIAAEITRQAAPLGLSGPPHMPRRDRAPARIGTSSWHSLTVIAAASRDLR
jgi:hypothetical protein